MLTPLFCDYALSPKKRTYEIHDPTITCPCGECDIVDCLDMLFEMLNRASSRDKIYRKRCKGKCQTYNKCRPSLGIEIFGKPRSECCDKQYQSRKSTSQIGDNWRQHSAWRWGFGVFHKQLTMGDYLWSLQ